MRSSREPDPLLAEELLADAEPDFASEHQHLTAGDLEGGGPEHAPEPESPKGYGGADFHRTRRPREHRQPQPATKVMALARPADTKPVKRKPTPEPKPSRQPKPSHQPKPGPTRKPIAEPGPELELEPDFAQEHRHLTVGSTDMYRADRNRLD